MVLNPIRKLQGNLSFSDSTQADKSYLFGVSAEESILQSVENGFSPDEALVPFEWDVVMGPTRLA